MPDFVWSSPVEGKGLGQGLGHSQAETGAGQRPVSIYFCMQQQEQSVNVNFGCGDANTSIVACQHSIAAQHSSMQQQVAVVVAVKIPLFPPCSIFGDSRQIVYFPLFRNRLDFTKFIPKLLLILLWFLRRTAAQRVFFGVCGETWKKMRHRNVVIFNA